MNRKLRATLLASMFFGAVSQVDAAEISLKGLSLGMTRAEYEAIYPPDPPVTTGTLADVFGRPHASFDEDKLVGWYFFFSSDWFEDMLDSLQAKYPGLRCRSSLLQNGFGAGFQQVKCRLSTKTTLLSIERFVFDDIEDSRVSLENLALIKQQEAQSRQQRRGDL